MTATETHSPRDGPRVCRKNEVARAVLVMTHRFVPIRQVVRNHSGLSSSFRAIAAARESDSAR